MSSIFSTYSTGENRVTASILAVLKSLSLGRIQKLLGNLLEQSEFELVRFENQPAKEGKGVPDAVIHSSVRLFVETKLNRNAVDREQIVRHLKRLDSATEAVRTLLVLTPDGSRPGVLDTFTDDRLAWASFTALDQAIDEMLGDKYEVVSEREAFLLRELQNMLDAEGLLASEFDVVVVAARHAWPEYNQIAAYVCQPERSFKQVSRIAFYSKGQVYPLVPKILEAHERVTMVKGQYEGQLGALVDRLIREQRREEGGQFKVVILSAPDSPETIRLPAPIPNDLTSKAGKPTAFTMGQRYVSSEKLLSAKATSHLV
jgi:hypothetical protein